MIAFLKGWIINIVSLVILIVILEMLLPSSKYKKIVHLITGFIIIIVIITPFLQFVNKKIDLKSFQISNAFYIDQKEMMDASSKMEEVQMKQIRNLYREKIIKEIRNSLLEIEEIDVINADIIMNENSKSERFGEIKQIILEIKLQTEGAQKGKNLSINPVVIDLHKETKEKEIELNPKITKKIEERLEKLFFVKKENIVIHLL